MNYGNLNDKLRYSIFIPRAMIHHLYGLGERRTSIMRDVPKDRSWSKLTQLQADVLGVIAEYAVTQYVGMLTFGQVTWSIDKPDTRVWEPVVDKDFHKIKGVDVCGFIEVKRIEEPHYNVEVQPKAVKINAPVLACHVAYEMNGSKIITNSLGKATITGWANPAQDYATGFELEDGSDSRYCSPRPLATAPITQRLVDMGWL